jgi:hypothetical protein
VSDWLDEFTVAGERLNGGEKNLMRLAMNRERERIIKLLEPLFDTAENAETRRLLTMAIALIKGENK